MNNLNEFTLYFKSIADSHIDLKYFVCGAVDSLLKMLSESRTLIEYPCLLVETPSYKLKRNSKANFNLKPSSAFIVLQKAPKEDFFQEGIEMNKSLEIILDILAKIEKDRLAEKVSIDWDSILDIEPVAPLGPDYLVGYRVEFNLDNITSLCYKPEKWNV